MGVFPEIVGYLLAIKAIIRTFVLCAILSLFSLIVRAETGTLRFVTEHWPPYNYLDDSGNVIGIASEKVREIADSLDKQLHIDVYHWARAIQLAEQESNIFLYSIYRTPSRESRFRWICPLLQTQSLAFYRLSKRNDIQIDKIEDAKQYRISVMNGDLTMRILQNAGFEKGVHFETAIDEMTNLRKLIHGRIDLIVQEDNALQYRLKQLQIETDQLVRLEALDKENADTLCIATSLKTDPEIVEKIQQVLAQDN